MSRKGWRQAARPGTRPPSISRVRQRTRSDRSKPAFWPARRTSSVVPTRSILSQLIRSEAAVDWIDDSDALSDVPSVIEAITLAVAYRAYQNPTGASQTSLGDASVSYAREGSSGAVYLTRDERKAVRKAAGISSVGSIALVSPWLSEAANYYYAEVEGGGDPIPLGPFPWEL